MFLAKLMERGDYPVSFREGVLQTLVLLVKDDIFLQLFDHISSVIISGHREISMIKDNLRGTSDYIRVCPFFNSFSIQLRPLESAHCNLTVE